MRRIIWGLLIIFLVYHTGFIQAQTQEEGKKNEEIVNIQEEFIATNEFQEIKEGMPIPRGLHVRVNMETGKVEAKLADSTPTISNEGKEEEEEKPIVQETSIVVVEGASEVVSKEELKAKFKKNKAKNQAVPKAESETENHNEGNEGVCGMTKPKADEGCGSDSNKAEERRERQPRTELIEVPSESEDNSEAPKPMTKERLEELKEIWEVITKAVNSEPESLKNSILTLQNDTSSLEDQKLALETMEGIVHMYDYGRDFVVMGGGPYVVRLLFNEDPELKLKAASVLASALQSNPGVQLYFYEDLKLMGVLLERLENDQDKVFQRKILLVISCLLRGFPQAEVSEFAGRLSQYFVKSTDEVAKTKCMTLVTDLAREEREKEAETKYIEEFVQQNWCHNFISALSFSSGLNSIEKGLEGIDEFSIHCLQNEKVIASLNRFKEALQTISSSVNEYPQDRIEEFLSTTSRLLGKPE